MKNFDWHRLTSPDFWKQRKIITAVIVILIIIIGGVTIHAHRNYLKGDWIVVVQDGSAEPINDQMSDYDHVTFTSNYYTYYQSGDKTPVDGAKGDVTLNKKNNTVSIAGDVIGYTLSKDNDQVTLSVKDYESEDVLNDNDTITLIRKGSKRYDNLAAAVKKQNIADKKQAKIDAKQQKKQDAIDAKAKAKKAKKNKAKKAAAEKNFAAKYVGTWTLAKELDSGFNHQSVPVISKLTISSKNVIIEYKAWNFDNGSYDTKTIKQTTKETTGGGITSDDIILSFGLPNQTGSSTENSQYKLQDGKLVRSDVSSTDSTFDLIKN